MPRVVVACRANSKKEWEICYICQEADHAPYVAQEIKNQEGKNLFVGYLDEDDFFNGKHNKIKLVKEGGTLPPPESSVKKFKEEPMAIKRRVYVPPPIAPPTPVDPPTPKPAEPKEKVEEKKDVHAPVTKPTSELGLFRKDKK
jgi:hypothetical protein